jgi:alpha-mannosidase
MVKPIQHISADMPELENIPNRTRLRPLFFIDSFPFFFSFVLLMSLTSTSLRAAAESQPPAALKEVIIVFKTHFDLGYTDFASNVIARYRTSMIDEALKVVDKNAQLPLDKQFVWTIPGWPAAQIAQDWPGQTPERKAKIQRAFASGRFVGHGLPFTTHTEMLEPEEVVRGLRYSSALCKSLGLPLPRDAKMTDVPCHSWLLPTVLRHAGIEFLHLGCNAASSSPDVPPLFWWEGPDGSRLLTFYSAAGYGSGLLPPENWPYRSWLALIHTGDNHGPPTPEEVNALLVEATQKLPGIKVRIGRLSDFSDSLKSETAEIPVVRGDMPDTWIHGPMCDPAGAKVAREIRPAMTVTEALNAQLQLWGVIMPSSAPSLARAAEKSLLYSEHTWGGALAWVTRYSGKIDFEYGSQWDNDKAAGRFKKLEDSWSEHSAYILDAQAIVRPLLQTNLHILARIVAVEGKRIMVYNPLPWKRDGLVTFTDTKPEYQAVQPVESMPRPRPPRRSRRDPLAKEVIEPSAVPVAWNGNNGSFIAKDIPPMGYLTFIPSTNELVTSGHLKTDGKTLENHFFRVTLDQNSGCLKSIIDKASNREWVDPAAAHGFGQYLYERFDAKNIASFVNAYVKIDADWATNELGKPNPHLLESPKHQISAPKKRWLMMATNTLGNGSTWQTNAIAGTATMVCEGSDKISHKVTTKVVLYRDFPWIDLEITLHDKPATPWPEAGWLALPFRVEQPQFRVGRPGSIIDPAKDIVPGANRYLYSVNTGVAMFDERGHGAGFCSLDSPLVSLGAPGCWQYSKDYVPQKAAAYVNLYNNQWSTNFRLWNSGTWSYRVRIWAINHYEPGGGLITPAMEARYPMETAVIDAPAGRVPVVQEGISLDRKGMMITELFKNPSGRGFFLRLWEMSGQSGTCEILFPRRFKARSLQPVDLRGNIYGGAIAVKPDSLRMDRCVVLVQAFAPATFLVDTHP